jgi:hypothetical protein
MNDGPRLDLSVTAGFLVAEALGRVVGVIGLRVNRELVRAFP